MFRSNFSPSPAAETVMRSGRMIDTDELPSDMMNRVVTTAFSSEQPFSKDSMTAMQLFGTMCDRGEVVMSTPVLTNAGRYKDKPLTACTMPPVDLRGDLSKVKRTIDTLHQQGMGTGFNLTDAVDPVSMLKYLNGVAVEGAESGREDRPVGNMAIISVRHPRIREFIDAKRSSVRDGSSWKFNISIDVDNAFMEALFAGDTVTLSDNTAVSANELFEQITAAAYECADPGLIFLDRMNDRNPTPGIGAYETTAPCAEVGLAPGETCQFGYINLGMFVRTDRSGNTSVDYEKLAVTAQTMTRALDNCLELSLQRYTTPKSASIMTMKRKIGVGICGVADFLVAQGLPYDSPQAVSAAQEAIMWVNYQTKLASVDLAATRGSCGAMALANIDPTLPHNRHIEDIPLLERLFGDAETKLVDGDMWKALALSVKDRRHLRNVTTTALPPTGRSSLVIDASTGIEPHFTITGPDGKYRRSVSDYLHRMNINESRMEELLSGGDPKNDCERSALEVCKGATAISALGHLNMAAGAQKAIDEAVSKTVNMPPDTKPSDVAGIYRQAWESGMSGITIYREGTHMSQPIRLRSDKDGSL